MAFLPTVPPRSSSNSSIRFSTPRIDFSGSQSSSDGSESFSCDVNSRSYSAVGGAFSQSSMRPLTSGFITSAPHRRLTRPSTQSYVPRNALAGSSSSFVTKSWAVPPFSIGNKHFGGLLPVEFDEKRLDLDSSFRTCSDPVGMWQAQTASSLLFPRWTVGEESRKLTKLSLNSSGFQLEESSQCSDGAAESTDNWNIGSKNGVEQELVSIQSRCDNHDEVELSEQRYSSLLEDTESYNSVIEFGYGLNIPSNLERKDRLLNSANQAVLINDRHSRSWNYTMDSLLKSGKIEECIRTFLSMPSLGVKRDVASWSIYVTALGRMEKYNEAEQSLSSMHKEHIQPNIYTYSALIEALGKGGLCLRALRQFRAMSELDNISPNTVTYNAVIKILSRCRKNDCGGIRTAMGLFREMHSKGCIPDVVTYATLIDAFSKRKEPEKAFKLFREMKNVNIKPNNYCYSSIISAFSRVGQIEKALSILDEMVLDNIFPDVFAFNALIDGFGKLRHVDKAFEIYQRMKKMNVKPDRITFNALISAAGRAKNLSRALEAQHDMVHVFGFSPDRHTYNALIDACGKAGNFTKAYEIFEEMQSSGIRPCTVTFNALIYGASRCQDLGGAFNIVDQMLRAGLHPDSYTMNTLLSACSRRQDLRTAFEVLEKFKQLDVQPDNVTFNTLIDAVGKLDSFEKMFELLAEMESRGIPPSKVTLNTIIGCCGRRGRIDLMERGLDMFEEKQLEPDHVTFSLLIETYSASNMVDKAIALYERCKVYHFEIAANVLSHFVESLLRNGKEEVAKQVLKKNPFIVGSRLSKEGYRRLGTCTISTRETK
eukprot:jgi/Galph1/4098/GphlegSOOS_G2739.1